MSENAVNRAQSFGRVAEAYDTYRPAMPVEFAMWLRLGPGVVVADVAAGTGLVSRTLASTGARVISVEPDPAMLAQLVARDPSADARLGPAEQLPLADTSIDVVTIVSAWHWVEPSATLAEISRVLRDEGSLAVAWNGPDTAVPWVRELLRLRDPAGGPTDESVPRHDPRVVRFDDGFPLRRTDEFLHEWSWPRTVDQIVGLFGTYSGVITGRTEPIDDVVEAVTSLLQPRLRDGVVHLPMAVRAVRAVRAAR